MTMQGFKYSSALWPNPSNRGDAVGYANLLIDASGEKVTYLFQVPKTGNMRTIRARTGTVTSFQTLKGGFYTVDGSGLPTASAYGGMVAGTQAVDPGSNADFTVTMGTDAAATEGDFVAATVEFNSTAGNLNIAGSGSGTGVRNCYAVHEAPALTLTKQTSTPVFAIGYDDGTYEPIIGAYPFTSGLTTTGFNSGTATADEYALKFTVPFKCRLKGMLVMLACAAGANFEYINYSGTSPVTGMTGTRDGDHVNNTGMGIIALLWGTPEDLAANAVRYLSIRPTTANNVTIARGTVASTAVMGAVPGGGNWFTATRLDNTGAWDETRTTEYPFILPIYDQLPDDAGGASGGGIRLAGSGGLAA